MTILNLSDPRTQRALHIVAGASQWAKCRTKDGRKMYGVPSQSDPNRRYLVTCRSCDCADFQRRQQPCKHVTAVRTFVALVKASTPAPTPTPTLDPTLAAAIFDHFKGD